VAAREGGERPRRLHPPGTVADMSTDHAGASRTGTLDRG